ncbi:MULTISPECIES: response regulator [unclassified Pseudodesulfovibrio]|uniref:hybrid sensor histidine kinase/response regulator n=1 Tax=unclassified Pseudodesulfovibrio TaxID=2661612 RepID=UPI000FEBED9F|nr:MULTISPECIES: response regulator [unclassified Pseudodesulfovibrio]MCJ2164384.1 response regulator [Pseudodesulfovibrio sp. S3-i]RWU04591.1 response regulator [Pseudodesulfovibrio sp. S3]
MDTADRPTVLVVDDNRLNIDLLVDILKDDYKLLVALNGISALELIQNTLPDIILLDIMMPEMDGYEVCKRLKSAPRTQSIPIIFITAKAQTEDEAKGLSLGAVDYITKPVNPAIVQARIKTHLALYNQNRELEEKVRVRTSELESSREKANEASKAKSAFLANISHELRTPLNHIMGLSSLLLEMDDNPERMELIRPINEGAAQLTGLFDQLLSLTMLESDAIRIRFQAFDFMKALSQQTAIFRAYAQRRGLEFEFVTQETLPTAVHGAPVETVQALNNILLNAFRYTEKGKVTLEIRIDPDNFAGADADKVMLRFMVKDTGIGIPEERLKTIFNSFEIGEKVMTKRLSGSGIGLTISKYLIEKLNGKIWVESAPGKGSTFYFSLPFTILDRLPDKELADGTP